MNLNKEEVRLYTNTISNNSLKEEVDKEIYNFVNADFSYSHCDSMVSFYKPHLTLRQITKEGLIPQTNIKAIIELKKENEMLKQDLVIMRKRLEILERKVNKNF